MNGCASAVNKQALHRGRFVRVNRRLGAYPQALTEFASPEETRVRTEPQRKHRVAKGASFKDQPK